MSQVKLLDEEKDWLMRWAKKWRDHPKLSGEQQDLLALHDLLLANEVLSEREIKYVKAYRNSLISQNKHTKLVASKQADIRKERERKKLIKQVSGLHKLASAFNTITEVIGEDAALTYGLLDKLNGALQSAVDENKKILITEVIMLLEDFGLERPVPKVVVNHTAEYQEVLRLLREYVSEDVINKLKPLTTNRQVLQELNRIAVPPPPKPKESPLAPVYENPDLAMVVKRKTKFDYDNL